MNAREALVKKRRSCFVHSMPQRSTPQAKIDEQAFPVRVRSVNPDFGLGRTLDQMYAWLNERVGRESYAIHGGSRGPTGDRIAIYFRHPAPALAFVEAFPMLEIADGTILPGYSTPNRAPVN